MSKIVLVTGCSAGGIGFAMCKSFAQNGCKVYATARNVDKMRGFKNPNIETLALNVNNDDEVRSVVKHIIDAEGRIDVVVNNAGGICIGPLIDIPFDQVKEAFDTNTFAALRVAKAVMPSMAQRKSGTIVNIGSVVGDIPTPWNGIYSASKAALHSLTEVLMMEAKPFNISVMLVSPGSVRSNISKNANTSFDLPADSIYGAFLPSIVMRMHASQGPKAMPTDDFARKIVSNVLKEKPPSYISIGGNSTIFSVLKWLPRAFVLWLMWRRYSARS